MVKTLTSTCMIGLYVCKSFPIKIESLETPEIIFETIIHFVNLWQN